jgi:low temperature requirement protein LtrA
MPAVTSEAATSERSKQSVSWFELFYDLVIVAAVAQAGKVFIKSPDWGTTALIVSALLVLFCIWLLVTVSHGLFPGDDPIRRVIVLMQMMFISVAALALGEAGLPNWVGFACGGLALLAVTALYLRHLSGAGALRVTVRRVALCTGLGASLFLASALVSVWLTFEQSVFAPPILLLIGAVFILVPVLTVILRGIVEAGTLDTHHLEERFGLFVIIVLGESFVGLLAALGALGDIPSPVFFVLTFVVSFCIWSLYFNAVLPFGMPHGMAGLRWWIAGHALLVLSMVSVAVAFADLTLNQQGESTLKFQGSWTPLPLLGVLTALAILTAASRGCPPALRRVHYGAVAAVAILTVCDLLLVGPVVNGFTTTGAVVIVIDALVCTVIRKRIGAAQL